MTLLSRWFRRPIGVAVGLTVHGTVEWMMWPPRIGPGPTAGSVTVTGNPLDQRTLERVATQIRAALPYRRPALYIRCAGASAQPLRVALRDMLIDGDGMWGRERRQAGAYTHAMYAQQQLRARWPGRFCRHPFMAVASLPTPGDPYTVATDGSCITRPGGRDGRDPAAWAFVTGAGLVRAGTLRGSARDAELEAVLQALAFYPTGSTVTLLMDNLDVGLLVQECVEQAADGGRRPLPTRTRQFRWVSNDVHDRVYQLVATRTVHPRYVRGHSGHMLHDQADQVARNIARRYHRLLSPAAAPVNGPEVAVW